MTISQENKAKYLIPPTFEQIEEFRKKLGVRGATIEHYYALGRGTYYKYKIGEKNLPVRLWHIFYEQIVPQAGTPKTHPDKRGAKTTYKKSHTSKRNKPKSSSKAVLDKLSNLT